MSCLQHSETMLAFLRHLLSPLRVGMSFGRTSSSDREAFREALAFYSHIYIYVVLVTKRVRVMSNKRPYLQGFLSKCVRQFFVADVCN